MSGADHRVSTRQGLRSASVASIGLGALAGVVELRGGHAVAALVAAVLAATLQLLVVTRHTIGQTVPALVALAPCALGPLERAPRPTAVVTGVAVLLAAELARLAADQGDIPIAADPPANAVRAIGPVIALGAAASALVLLAGAIELASIGVLSALGALAVIVTAAVLAHPDTMLGRPLGDGNADGPPRVGEIAPDGGDSARFS